MSHWAPIIQLHFSVPITTTVASILKRKPQQSHDLLIANTSSGNEKLTIKRKKSPAGFEE